jgi:hypothetical protein
VPILRPKSSRELRAEQTATPAATVAATIAQSFKNDGEHSPFIRVSRGVYSLRETQLEAPAKQAEAEELAEAESSEVCSEYAFFGAWLDCVARNNRCARA